MKTSIVLGVLGAAGSIILFGQLQPSADAGGTGSVRVPPSGSAMTSASLSDDEAPLPNGPGIGPDVIVWTISGFENWSDATHRAYSVGTTSCNQGDQPLSWNGSTNQHPVIGQNMFRIMPRNGHPRFEQIGQSWLKHGFCALDLNDCGACQGTGCGSLGVGCSDPYTAARNGSQGPAGPKYQVNATTGFFPYPPANPSYSGSTARRLRVLRSDVEEASNPGATYLIEAMYIHPQDSPHINVGLSANNVSFRRVNLNSTGAISSFNGSTERMQVALIAWVAEDSANISATRINIAGEGTVWLGHAAWDNGDGTWDYEYVVNNLNFDRSVGAFEVPVPDGVVISNVGFHQVEYHSGEVWSNAPWTSSVGGGAVRWETESYGSNPNASAIRWATAYTFRFTANTPPQNASLKVEYFKPGAIMSNTRMGRSPSAPPVPCPADVDGSGTVDFNDALLILASWGNCPGCPEDIDGSGTVDFTDVLEVLAAWGDC